GVGSLGNSLANVGDVDGDGFDDLLAGGTPSNTSDGEVVLFSGKDGSVVRTFTGQSGDLMGVSLVSIGDANGDGVPDFAIGSPGADQTSFQEYSGAVDLFSGADGSLLWRRYGDWNTYYDSYFVLHYQGDALAGSLAACGDFNADGIPDVVAVPSIGQVSGLVRILSGADGTDVRTWNLGGDPRPAPATLSDDDGDGLPEIVFAASDFIAIESSLGGRILWRTDANGAWGYSAAARTADFDGDGRDDFVLGIDTDSTNFVDEGRAELR